jgi:DNA invertase Pin-like site-specific DNA recombinase
LDKTKTIFDHLAGITSSKVPWNKLSDLDKKSFSVYLINRWLSMNMDFIEIVNEFQKYTIGQITPQETYKIYYDFLPKQKQFNKYIKGKKAEKYNQELVELLSKHFLISEKEAVEYLELYTGDRLLSLKEIVKKYGKTDKEVDKLLKNK